MTEHLEPGSLKKISPVAGVALASDCRNLPPIAEFFRMGREHGTSRLQTQGASSSDLDGASPSAAITLPYYAFLD
jgi:hypothetical protein